MAKKKPTGPKIGKGAEPKKVFELMQELRQCDHEQEIWVAVTRKGGKESLPLKVQAVEIVLTEHQDVPKGAILITTEDSGL